MGTLQSRVSSKPTSTKQNFLNNKKIWTLGVLKTCLNIDMYFLRGIWRLHKKQPNTDMEPCWDRFRGLWLWDASVHSFSIGIIWNSFPSGPHKFRDSKQNHLDQQNRKTANISVLPRTIRISKEQHVPKSESSQTLLVQLFLNHTAAITAVFFPSGWTPGATPFLSNRTWTYDIPPNTGMSTELKP